MATALRDQDHDHNIVIDLVGLVLAVALAFVVIAGSLTAAVVLLLRWVNALGG